MLFRSYEDVLPFFKKAENNETLKDDYHGTGGPLNVAEQRSPLPINEAFLKACEQAVTEEVVGKLSDNQRQSLRAGSAVVLASAR